MKKIFILCLISTLFITSCSTVQQLVTTTMNIALSNGEMDPKTADFIVSTTQSVYKATEQISPENEYYIGRATAAIILNDYDLYSEPKLTKYLNKICGAITINSEKIIQTLELQFTLKHDNGTMCIDNIKILV